MINVPINLSNSKSKVDVETLVPIPVDLCKLNDAVKNGVVKKDLYTAKIKSIEVKIPDITNLVTNAFLNAKINEVIGEIPNNTNLATTSPLTVVEIEIPNVS